MGKKKIKRVKGFVMNRKTGHVSYAFKQEDKNVNSLGFTHNGKDIASKKKLKYNINPNDETDCYVKTNIEKQKYNTYRQNEKFHNYRIHSDDLILIKMLMNENKKRR